MSGSPDVADHAVFEQGASAGNVGRGQHSGAKEGEPSGAPHVVGNDAKTLAVPFFHRQAGDCSGAVDDEREGTNKGGDSTTQVVKDAVITNLD
ncbi:hypothetical protein MLD38_023095 [Melastoma candidum]|uniref:Uncharacterized protein n=1 Tax=Melastoma candidum TaxID=119954 RepID=A0ACB9QN81_9MYRT|nr:hypothetical protein MLD38_023095 [Melastoma candidum]